MADTSFANQEVAQEEVAQEEVAQEEVAQEEVAQEEVTQEDIELLNTETHEFQAEISQLMNLIINAFYSNKEIFLRELISNSSDAIDKIRHKNLVDGIMCNDDEYKIEIIADKKNNILQITDTGIGMAKKELQTNLGTIAHSGTKQFMETLKSGNGDLSMIGQFGVGFYSAYLVADKVQVITKSEDDEQCYMWQSAAGGSYTISECNELKERGTSIRLHIKEDQQEYLDNNRIKNIIKMHSQYVGYPIKLLVEKTKEEEITDDEEDDVVEEVDADTNNEGETEEVDEDEEEKKKKKKKTKKISTNYSEWENMNKEKPIWTKKSSEITKEEYKSFYTNLTNDFEYEAVKSFSVEGSLEFKGIIYIPKHRGYDMFNTQQKKRNIKLHVRRVFITDDCEDLVPEWLTFIKGIVDSEDLPLNVSREMMQQNKIIKSMRKNLIKKTIELIDEIKEDDENKQRYNDFYNNFSKNIKLGAYEEDIHREKLASFFLFNTSKSDGKMHSLDQYIENMGEGEENIYYITGESNELVDMSPFVEKLKKQNKEVVYMIDPIDEYVLQKLSEYKGKKLVSITKDNLNLDDEDKEEDIKEYEEVCKFIKNHLGNKVESVKLGQRIVESPCCLVTGQHGWSANMERLMKAQTLGDDQYKSFMMSSKIMEINKDHKIVKELKRRLEEADGKKDATVKDLVDLIYDISILRSGFTLENTHNFSKRIYKIIELGLSIDDSDEDSENDDNIQTDNQENVIDSSEDTSKMEEVD